MVTDFHWHFVTCSHLLFVSGDRGECVSAPPSPQVLSSIAASSSTPSASAYIRGRTYTKKLRFLRKKRAGYANLKMPCVYYTQKTVTSHIKMRLVFSFFAPSREGLQSTCRGSKHLRFPPPPPPSLPHPIPVNGCWCLRYDVHDTHRH